MRTPTLSLLLLIGAIGGCNWSTTGTKGPGGTDVRPPTIDPGTPPVPADRNAYIATDDPLGESVTKVVYLPQNWSPAETLKFYFTSQGSQIIPYDWFLALERPDSEVAFADRRNMLRYRYLPQNPGPMNPDGLPVGFVGGQGVGRRWLGLTCAACHTAEIRFGTTGYRVDGAPTHADAQGFFSDLALTIRKTKDDPAKFSRFAAKVLGAGDNPGKREALATDLARSYSIRDGYNRRNFVGYDPAATASTPLTRYGRLDAVDAIVNEVYWHAVKAPDPARPTVVAKPADALVSYPCLWDTPQHDKVEWLGIAQGGGPLGLFSLARNVGEALGVFADFAIPDEPSLLNLGYSSSVEFSALEALEALMTTLWSPTWPADFPAIVEARRSRGEALYKERREGGKSCLDCHAILKRDDPRRSVKAVIVATGTDRRAADNFFETRRSSGRLEGVNINFVPFTAKVEAMADADSMLSNVAIGVILGRLRDAPRDQLARINFRGDRTREITAVAAGVPYKARPLNGIWATAPYLHNGSVPTLADLLRPDADRPKRFSVGVRTFDPVKVGFLTDVPGFPTFEVAKPDGTPIVGNSNAGHTFGASWSDEERSSLVEYLKTL